MAFKNNDIIDAMADIVDSIRTSGTYTSVFDGVYTICTSPNSFKINEFVIIDNTDLRIYAANSTSFKVKGDYTGESTWKSAAPYFAYGHILEIADALAKKDNSTQELSFKKYPIVILVLDVKKRPNQKLQTTDYENVNIIIANKTKPSYVAADRKIENFEPILHPLYERLITELSRSKLLNNSDSIPFIKHVATDRYFWGTELNSNSKNVFNDFLDAVDIRELNIKLQNIKC